MKTKKSVIETEAARFLALANFVVERNWIDMVLSILRSTIQIRTVTITIAAVLRSMTMGE